MIGAATIVVPVAHFIIPWISPLVAGFLGGWVAKADKERVTLFGLAVGGMFAPLLGAFGVVILAWGENFLSFEPLLAAILVFALIPVAWFMVTIGALLGYLLRAANQTS